MDPFIDYLDDSKYWIAALGVFGVVVFGVAWIKIGRLALLVALVSTALLAGLLLLLGLFVPTQRKQVKATLHQIARDAENNDIDAVVSHIHGNSVPIQNRVRRAMNNYRIQRVGISNLRIEVEPDRDPPRAVTHFTIKAIGGLHSGDFEDQAYLRYLIVTFYKEDDQWLVGAVEEKVWADRFKRTQR